MSAPRHWVLHVDLDQFIAAVELLRRPELRGRPVVVGGDGDPTKRGVVSTASYEAREFGVHSALPLRTAVRRCPDAVFLPVDHEAYEAASAEVMDTLRSLEAVVEVVGWDEAFLDVVTDDPRRSAQEVRAAVLAATRLDSSVGIGENKLQAKLATGYGKPGGVFMLTRQNWYAVLGHRPTDALWGVGSKTARRLATLGIATVNDLAATGPHWLAERVGPSTGPWLVGTARGIDRSPVVSDPYVARGRSREHTFQQDIEDWDDVRTEVRRLAAQVAADTAADGRAVARVVVKLRFRPFTTRTHAQKLPTPTSDPDTLESAALGALDRFGERRPVRLVGVRAEMLPPDEKATRHDETAQR